MVSVARASLVDIENLIPQGAAGGASRRMVQVQRDRSASFPFPLERPSRPLRGASGRGSDLVEMFHVKQTVAHEI
jgi:hypothetical protein